MEENMAIKSQVEENNSNATLDVNEVTDLKKSVEDSLEKLDNIMKSKSKKWTKKDIEEGEGNTAGRRGCTETT